MMTHAAEHGFNHLLSIAIGFRILRFPIDVKRYAWEFSELHGSLRQAPGW